MRSIQQAGRGRGDEALRAAEDEEWDELINEELWEERVARKVDGASQDPAGDFDVEITEDVTEVEIRAGWDRSLPQKN